MRSPRGPRIIAAPENMLNSTNIPKPIGKPKNINSLKVLNWGNRIPLKILIALKSFVTYHYNHSNQH